MKTSSEKRVFFRTAFLSRNFPLMFLLKHLELLDCFIIYFLQFVFIIKVYLLLDFDQFLLWLDSWSGELCRFGYAWLIFYFWPWHYFWGFFPISWWKLLAWESCSSLVSLLWLPLLLNDLWLMLRFVLSLGMEILHFSLSWWDLCPAALSHMSLLMRFRSWGLVVQLALEWFVHGNASFLNFVFFWATLIFHELLVVKALWCFGEMLLRFSVLLHRHLCPAALSQLIVLPRLLLSAPLTFVYSLVLLGVVEVLWSSRLALWLAFMLPLFHILQVIILMQLGPRLCVLLIDINFVLLISKLLLTLSLTSLVALIGRVLICLDLFLVISRFVRLPSVAMSPALHASFRSHVVRLFLHTFILPMTTSIICLSLFRLRQRSSSSILRFLCHRMLWEAILKLFRIIHCPPTKRFRLFLILLAHSQHPLIFFELPLKCFLLEWVCSVLGHIQYLYMFKLFLLFIIFN